MKKAGNKLLSVLAASVLAVCMFVPASAAGATLTMDKTTYTVGEKPVVSYTGTSKKDWIGIYHKGEVPGSNGVLSILYEYTSKTGQPDGTMDFSAPDQGIAVTSLPAGEYDAILCENDGYTVLARVSFTIEAAAAGAPKAVQYTSAGKGSGYADGTVVVTPPDSTAGITDYWLYWGDENGILAGYTPMIVPANGSSPVTFQIHSGNYIPHGANRLLAYSASGSSLSQTAAEASLTKGADMTEETPLYSFEVFSDTHITSDSTYVHTKHLDMAFKDIKATDPKSIGIFNVGDVTDGGTQAQYDLYKSIVTANEPGLPPLFYAVGNHDLRGGDWNAQISLFNKNTGMSAPYFSKVINNQTFIFLGSQTTGNNGGDFANLYSDQLSWLKTQLAQAAKGARPIFVFLHQPLINTTAGTVNGQGWNGVTQDSQLRAILDQYPQAIMFTGHTHWELDADHNMYDGKGTGATFFNDGAVGTLWTDAQTAKTGSQGLYVEVYTDKVLVRGRDFVSGKWISNAQFMSDTTKNLVTLANAVPTAKDGLIAQKAKVDELLAEISAMPASSQTELHDTADQLNGLKQQIDALQAQVDTVSGLIDNLPKPENVKITDATQIEAAKSAYDALTNEQKTLLGTKAGTLTSVLTALSALEASQSSSLPSSSAVSSQPSSSSPSASSTDNSAAVSGGTAASSHSAGSAAASASRSPDSQAVPNTGENQPPLFVALFLAACSGLSLLIAPMKRRLKTTQR